MNHVIDVNWFDSLSKIKNDKTYRRANICLLLSSSTALSFDVDAISWMWIEISTFVASKVTCLQIINPIKIGELAIISCITSCGTLSFCRIYVEVSTCHIPNYLEKTSPNNQAGIFYQLSIYHQSLNLK